MSQVLALDDREERRRERLTRLDCQANASVSVDQSDAPDHRPEQAFDAQMRVRSLTSREEKRAAGDRCQPSAAVARLSDQSTPRT